MINKEDISKDFQNKIKAIEGGICAVSNVEVAGFRDGKYGVALILSPDSDVAGVFTSNKVIAAPVDYTKRMITTGKISAIVANSGNANCFTGDQGVWDCENIVKTVSELLNINKNEIATASTGVIGRKMPMDIINNLINKASKRLENSDDASIDAAKAIMTLDTVYKESAVEVTLENGKTVTIGAICKGVGMIAPNMGTMLCFIATDAVADQKILKKSLKIAVDDSFNMVVVDGDESTNDTVLLFANGESNNTIINTNNTNNADKENNFSSSDKQNFGINLNLNLGANTRTNIDLGSSTEKSKINPEDILNKIKGNLGINLDLDIDGKSVDINEDNIKAFTFGNADFNVDVNGVCVANSNTSDNTSDNTSNNGSNNGSDNSSNADSTITTDSDGNINIDINDEFDISDIDYASDVYIDKNFQEALNVLCKDLAKQMAKDGEGATKFLEVEVNGARTKYDAQIASKSVVESSLVKTAVFGGDPNWGRIVAAIGYSGASMDPTKITVAVSSENDLSYLVLDGEILAFEDTGNLKDAEELMKNKEIKIIIDLNEGKHDAVAYGCDLTYDYVRINSEYTT